MKKCVGAWRTYDAPVAMLKRPTQNRKKYQIRGDLTDSEHTAERLPGVFFFLSFLCSGFKLDGGGGENELVRSRFLLHVAWRVIWREKEGGRKKRATPVNKNKSSRI